MQIVHGPRPKGKIRPDQLPSYEKSGEWWAQRKFNGDKNTIHYKDGKIEFWNKGSAFTSARYKVPTKLFEEQFSTLNLKSGDYWFDSELINTHVPDTIVLYDVLQTEGQMLIGMAQEDRLKLLDEICGHPKTLCVYPQGGIALQVTQNIWLAEHFDRDLTQRYEEYLHLALIEGLVLRKRSAPLREFGLKAYETDDQIRCRKGSKNYRF